MSLSALELSQMRGDQEAYFPDTCTLQTVTRTIDDVGGWSEAWADTYTGVECRVSPEQTTKGSEALSGAQLVSATGWLLSVDHDQTLNVEMRCVHDSRTYEIASVEDTHSNRTARRAHLQRID